MDLLRYCLAVCFEGMGKNHDASEQLAFWQRFESVASKCDSGVDCNTIPWGLVSVTMWAFPRTGLVNPVASNPVSSPYVPPYSHIVISKHFYQIATKGGRKPYPRFTHYSQSNGYIFAPTSTLFFLITNLEIISNKSCNNSSHVSFISLRVFSRCREKGVM
jgi:hypothetical protein